MHHRDSLGGLRRLPFTGVLLAGAVVAAGIALPATPAHAVGAGTHAYVTDLASDSVHIVDVSGGTTEATVPVGSSPYSVVVSADGLRAYTVNYGDNTVSVIDTVQEAVVATIQLPGAIPGGAYEAALSPTGTTLYVVDYYNNALDTIDTATNTVIKTVSAPDSPGSVVATSSEVYVGSYSKHEVSVYDATSLDLETTIPLQAGPEGLTLVPNTNLIYVAQGGDGVTAGVASVIDTATDTVAETGTPFYYGGYQVAASPDGSRAYVTDYDGGLDVFQTSTGTPLTRLSDALIQGSTDVAVGPDGRIYLSTITDTGTGLQIVDPSTLTVVGSIAVPGEMSAVAIGTIAPAPAVKADVQGQISGPSSGKANRAYTYTVTAKDAGPGAASGVSAGLLLPPRTTLVSATGTYVKRGQLVLWKAVPLLGVNASSTFQVTVKFATKGAKVLLGGVWSNTPDPKPFNNMARRGALIS